MKVGDLVKWSGHNGNRVEIVEEYGIVIKKLKKPYEGHKIYWIRSRETSSGEYENAGSIRVVSRC